MANGKFDKTAYEAAKQDMADAKANPKTDNTLLGLKARVAALEKLAGV